MAIKFAPPPIRPKNQDPKGKKKTEALATEARARMLYASHTETLACVSQNPYSRLDCILHDLHSIRAVVEIKSRTISRDKIREYGSYLISSHKIDAGVNTSKALGAPFICIVALDDGIITWVVTSKGGKKLFKYDVEEREMQKNVNGGKKVGEVALLPVEEMNEFIPWRDKL